MLPIAGQVVVVEDDPTLQALMVDILEEVGGKAVAFGTADDALTYLLQSSEHCSLVIVDQGLPGQIQGTEFIELVKGKWPSVAAILVSGYQIEPATVPETTVYLHKPWSLDDMVTAVASLLQPAHPVQKRSRH